MWVKCFSFFLAPLLRLGSICGEYLHCGLLLFFCFFFKPRSFCDPGGHVCASWPAFFYSINPLVFKDAELLASRGGRGEPKRHESHSLCPAVQRVAWIICTCPHSQHHKHAWIQPLFLKRPEQTTSVYSPCQALCYKVKLKHNKPFVRLRAGFADRLGL